MQESVCEEIERQKGLYDDLKHKIDEEIRCNRVLLHHGNIGTDWDEIQYWAAFGVISYPGEMFYLNYSKYVKDAVCLGKEAELIQYMKEINDDMEDRIKNIQEKNDKLLRFLLSSGKWDPFQGPREEMDSIRKDQTLAECFYRIGKAVAFRFS